jgi:cyclopropane-fatty-acyl-phospholipid synthase
VGRLEANHGAAIDEVGEKAFRIWRVYMAGSAHAFERGWMSVFQVLAGRPDAEGALALPLTRDYIYEN